MYNCLEEELCAQIISLYFEI